MFHLVQYKDDTNLSETRVLFCKDSSDALKFMEMDGSAITFLEYRVVESYFRVVVAGGRKFKNYGLLKDRLDYYLSNKDKNGLIIVSGHAKGADLLGEKYAAERGLLIDTYIPDWQPTRLGGKTDKGAGHRRNAQMADNSDAGIIFWDGLSKGTEGMIGLLERKSIDHRIERY